MDVWVKLINNLLCTLAEGLKVEGSIGINKQRKQFGEAHVARLILLD